MRYPKQNSVIRLKSNILGWLRHCFDALGKFGFGPE